MLDSIGKKDGVDLWGLKVIKCIRKNEVCRSNTFVIVLTMKANSTLSIYMHSNVPFPLYSIEIKVWLSKITKILNFNYRYLYATFHSNINSSTCSPPSQIKGTIL